MPANFPEVWENRVRRRLEETTAAPWSVGVEELQTEIIELGSGTASEKNIIHIPIETLEVECLINNNVYPIPVQDFEDDSVQITLDKYQTKVLSVSDDQTLGASYPVIDTVSAPHVESINENKWTKALFALAPASNTSLNPVVEATGPERTPGGPKMLLYKDLVALKRKLDAVKAPKKGRRLILSDDHWNDMLLEEEKFAKVVVNYVEGSVAPVICGFEIYSDLFNPYYTNAGVKLAFGQVPVSTDRQGTICFLVKNTVKKTGTTKQYFLKAEQNPRGQANELNYRHYFIMSPVRNKFLGAIY